VATAIAFIQMLTIAKLLSTTRFPSLSKEELTLS